jgi:5'-3' exonuclease
MMNNVVMDNILILDLHNFIWRASVSFNSNPNANKDYVMIFNFFRNLRALVEIFSPDKIFAVCEGHPKFRYDLFAAYKANRIVKNAAKQETVDKFFHVRNEIVRLLSYLPITLCRAADYEADDVIATLVDNMKDEKLVVVSNDSDYIQLLQKGYKHLEIYNPMKKEMMKAPTYPYVVWKCLNGDKSDNIPGLLKPKKALECASNPEEFKKFMEIEENRSNFNINRQLIEFRIVPEDDIVVSEGITSFSLLKDEFRHMEFESIINDTSWEKFRKTFENVKY